MGSTAQRPVLACLGCFVLCALGLLAFAAWGSRVLDPPRSSWTARWVEDADGDGTPDFVLSTPDASSRSEPRMFSGATGRELDERVPRGAVHLGGALGDLDGDGRGESWWADEDDVVLRSSGSPGLGRRIERTWSELVGALDDLDGDGVRDLLIGGHPTPSGTNECVSAVSTRTGAVLWTVERAENPARNVAAFARNGCVIDDLDGDGTKDAAVIDGYGYVEVLSGRDGHTLRKITPSCGRVASTLVPLGDVDGDGESEILVDCGSENTAVVVSCVDGRELHRIPKSWDVWEAHSPGDVDGDGLVDVAWSGQHATCVSTRDGSRIGYWSDAEIVHGRADCDLDGYEDLMLVRDVVLGVFEGGAEDVWRRGRIEIVSGKSLEVVRVFDADALGLPR